MSTSKIETRILRFVLTPLDRVHFGKEKSPFQEEYFLATHLFPQQTTLLGFLRYEILRRTGVLTWTNGRLKINDRDKAARLIGPQSFDASNKQDFGMIERISPVSAFRLGAEETGDDFFLYRNPCGLKEKLLENLRVSFDASATDRIEFSWFPDFDSKDFTHFGEILFSQTSEERPFCLAEPEKVILQKNGVRRADPSTGIWVKDLKPGITKPYGGQSKDDGYFKLEYLRMIPGWAYSFQAELINDDELDWSQPAVVKMGGDSSSFKLEIREGKDWSVGQGKQGGNCIVLLSDAWVSNGVYDHCELAVTDTQHFRNLKTSVNDSKFYKRPVIKWHRKNQLGFEWDTYQGRTLLKRGSLLKIKKEHEGEFQTAIKSEAFEAIGYNHYLKLNEWA